MGRTARGSPARPLPLSAHASRTQTLPSAILGFVTAAYTLRASALLNVMWIPLALQEAALLAIAVPAKLLALEPGHYTSALAALASLSAVVSMIAPPFAGMLSDHLRRRGGGRKTVIVTGAVVDVVCLILAAYADTTMTF